MAREKVAIIGGGVAGLSAAHELVERGFDVEVYERRDRFGGKAASYRVDGKDDGLPGEHGFRFFPGWYKHLTDTMRRIPYHDPTGGRRRVVENLVSVRSNLLAWFDRSPVSLPLQLPGSLSEAAATSQFIAEFSRLGLTAAESAFFMRKLVELLIMSDERRVQTLENKSWWEYLDCDGPERSRAYQDFVRASTRTSVAAKAEEVSAYTVGRLVVRTLLDTLGSVDRVLNGPTSEVWIQPWVDHLTSRGVVFHPNMELSSLVVDSGSSTIKHVQMEPILVATTRRLRNLVAQLRSRASASDPQLVEDTRGAAQQLAKLIANLPAESKWKPANAAQLCEALGGLLDELAQGRVVSEETRIELTAALDESVRFQAEHSLFHHTVEAEYFVLALPLEQLAYYVNRSTMLTHLAPELRRVVPLSREMDWMAGIQFYLNQYLDVAPGHLVGMDSNWSLTAIEQTQFWKDVALPPGVKAVLSVDIAAWDKKGRLIRKEAFNSSDEEIAREVWGELKEMLNKPNRSPVLREDMLVGGGFVAGKSFHLDDSIVDLRDRKKQASYERARGVRLGTLDESEADQPGEATRVGPQKVAENYMWGPPRKRHNVEPLLINRAGTRHLRPEACTSIPNLFLAGDFVKTDTDLACMEGANESARLAVNGILAASGSREERCRIWPFSPSRQAADALMSGIAPWRAARGVATVVSNLRDRLWKGIASAE